MTTQTAVPAPIAEAVATADATFQRLDDALAALADGDLHRAHFDGGWTIAQVVSHINMCTVLWLGDIKRVEADPELDFFFREEVGHDLTGYPPPTVELARKQLANTRRTLTTAGTDISPEALGRTVTIPDLGTRTIEEWTPLIYGHASSHAEQAFEIMRNRNVGPAGI